ncbi:DUF647-domain-containing protein [Piedraia hortae CBS 480.64]|uniref:DUF647-domain-containing protein n=1 Tax=Piedraia hortae CBS 480.64 TaxID=1314780 RepID=A0A6A7CAA2_9PEZI|nr:DUF647-domain-containing protein [Piedraia hortae CBS 480.64]
MKSVRDQTTSRISIFEHDDAGNEVASYYCSPADEGIGRIDIALPQAKPVWQQLLDVFLPTGYPQSVTKDYLKYQIYDSLQAFASGIAGLLSSRAVLSSVGVGDSDASPTAALLLSVLQESAGRVATILFAHRLGTALEPECKMYRLLADVLNDLAFALDCLSPVFPKTVRVFVLAGSSVLRALCGVAAGSAKASLSAHFACWGNLGELNAKDSSQETIISLLGMLVGSLVVSRVTRPTATWTMLVILLSMHLELNRRAVRAVSLRTLNRQRATLVYHQLKRGHVPSPYQVARDERIFERDGVLRDEKGKIMGHCAIGCPVKQWLAALPAHSSQRIDMNALSTIVTNSRDKAYLVVFVAAPRLQVRILMKQEARPLDGLTAWWHALALAEGCDDPAERAASLSRYTERLRMAGWDTESNALETNAKTRCFVPN